MQVEDVVVISDADAGTGPKSSTRAEFKDMLQSSSSSRQPETGEEEEEEASADQTAQVEEAAMSAHAARTHFYLRMSEVLPFIFPVLIFLQQKHFLILYLGDLKN